MVGGTNRHPERSEGSLGRGIKLCFGQPLRNEICKKPSPRRTPRNAAVRRGKFFSLCLSVISVVKTLRKLEPRRTRRNTEKNAERNFGFSLRASAFLRALGGVPSGDSALALESRHAGRNHWDADGNGTERTRTKKTLHNPRPFPLQSVRSVAVVSPFVMTSGAAFLHSLQTRGKPAITIGTRTATDPRCARDDTEGYACSDAVSVVIGR
jgi:hypothetical protein